MATPKDVADADAVDTAADFVAYLYLLHADLADDADRAKASGNPFYEGSWAHRDLATFLERWAAWLEAMVVVGRPHFPKDLIDPASWKSLARQLEIVRGYE